MVSVRPLNSSETTYLSTEPVSLVINILSVSLMELGENFVFLLSMLAVTTVYHTLTRPKKCHFFGVITHLLVQCGGHHTFTRTVWGRSHIYLFQKTSRQTSSPLILDANAKHLRVSRMSSLAKPEHKQNTTNALFVFETAGFFVRPINFVCIQYLQSPNIIPIPQTYSQFLPLLCLLKLQFVLNLDAKL